MFQICIKKPVFLPTSEVVDSGVSVPYLMLLCFPPSRAGHQHRAVWARGVRAPGQHAQSPSPLPQGEWLSDLTHGLCYSSWALQPTGILRWCKCLLPQGVLLAVCSVTQAAWLSTWLHLQLEPGAPDFQHLDFPMVCYGTPSKSIRFSVCLAYL